MSKRLTLSEKMEKECVQMNAALKDAMVFLRLKPQLKGLTYQFTPRVLIVHSCVRKKVTGHAYTTTRIEHDISFTFDGSGSVEAESKWSMHHPGIIKRIHRVGDQSAHLNFLFECKYINAHEVAVGLDDGK